MSQYRYVNNSSIDITSGGYYVPAWGFLQTNSLVLPLDSFVNNGLELTIDSKNQPLYRNIKSFTFSIGTYYIVLKEGEQLKLAGSSGIVATAQKVGGSIVNLASGITNLFGPYKGVQTVNIISTVGTIDASIVDGSLGANFPKTAGTYTYDSTGAISSYTYDSKEITYTATPTYDTSGRLSSQTISGDSITKTYTYNSDTAGRITSYTVG